jgi:hypothetical protein
MAAQPRRTDPDFDLLIRHASRALDPTTAVRFRDQQVHPTVYGGSRLLVRPTVDEDAVLERLREIASEFDLDVEVNAEDERSRQLAREAGISPQEPQPLLRRIELIPRSAEGLVQLPDAWPPHHAVTRGWDAITARAPTLQRPGQKSGYRTADARDAAGAPR